VDQRVIMASTFKERCLALLDQVEETKVTILVTKHGRPVARVVPVEEGIGARSTDGSVRLVAAEDEEYFSTGERWDAATLER
jgi:prevent-host-death family protein